MCVCVSAYRGLGKQEEDAAPPPLPGAGVTAAVSCWAQVQGPDSSPLEEWQVLLTAGPSFHLSPFLMHVYGHVEACSYVCMGKLENNHLPSLRSTFNAGFWNRASFTGLEFTKQARLAFSQDPEIFLSPRSHYWDYQSQSSCLVMSFNICSVY